MIEMQSVERTLTDCDMTISFKRCLSLLLPLTAALALNNSCIYDAPGDRFYRTLWISTGNDSDLGSVTLEFLCGGQVSVTSTAALGSFGYYESDDMQAWFTDLTLVSDNATITIVEAYRHGDNLNLIWFDESDLEQNSIMLHRLSAYPQ